MRQWRVYGGLSMFELILVVAAGLFVLAFITGLVWNVWLAFKLWKALK